MTTDTVSLFSLADAGGEEEFLSFSTASGQTLALTEGHHIPVGAACCTSLKQARDVALGDRVWIASARDGGPAVSTVVTARRHTTARGLHSPLLSRGSFPVVDGVVTSFNTMAIVRLDAYAVPLLTWLCKATRSCAPLRSAIAAVECVFKRVVGGSLCKTFKYIDGVEVRPPLSSPPVASIVGAPDRLLINAMWAVGVSAPISAA